jgi:hypothetical protein
VGHAVAQAVELATGRRVRGVAVVAEGCGVGVDAGADVLGRLRRGRIPDAGVAVELGQRALVVARERSPPGLRADGPGTVVDGVGLTDRDVVAVGVDDRLGSNWMMYSTSSPVVMPPPPLAARSRTKSASSSSRKTSVLPWATLWA